MKKLLTPEQKLELQAKGLAFRSALQSGQVEEAEKNALAAWNILPAPAVQYDHSESIARIIVEFYRDTKQFEKAVNWLDVAGEAYGGNENPYVLFLSATVYFESGDLEKAFLIFEEQFQKFKTRPFQGEKPEYLQFYQKETARRKKR